MQLASVLVCDAANVRIRATTPSGVDLIDMTGTVTARGDPSDLDGLIHYVPLQVALDSAALRSELGTHTVEVTIAGERREARLRVGNPLERVPRPRVDVELALNVPQAGEARERQDRR